MRKQSLRFLCALVMILVFSSLVCADNVKYAKGFSIEKDSNCTIITVNTPYYGSSEPIKYLLVPDGVQSLEMRDAVRISVPIKRVIVGATPVIACMEYLDLFKSLVGFAGGKYIYSDEIKSMNLPEVAGEGGMARSIDREKVISLTPDAFITYLYGEKEYEDVQFLSSHGVPVVLFAEYMEETPLGRAEWIKFVAPFFCLEDEAERIFSDVEKNYKSLLSKVGDSKDSPSVMMGAPFGGTWYVSNGESWPVKLIEMAGGTYPWKDLAGSGTTPMDVEAVLAQGASADIWINCGSWRSLSDAEKSEVPVKYFKSFQNGHLYNNDRRINENGGNDFYQTGVIRPDIVLKDLISILQPELGEDELFFYRKLK